MFTFIILSGIIQCMANYIIQKKDQYPNASESEENMEEDIKEVQSNSFMFSLISRLVDQFTQIEHSHYEGCLDFNGLISILIDLIEYGDFYPIFNDDYFLNKDEDIQIDLAFKIRDHLKKNKSLFHNWCKKKKKRDYLEDYFIENKQNTLVVYYQPPRHNRWKLLFDYIGTYEKNYVFSFIDVNEILVDIRKERYTQEHKTDLFK